jgi:hypothetical protein
MAAASRLHKKSSRKPANPTKKVSRARRAPPDIGADEIKRMVKAPGDYEGIARKFADALEATNFRGAVTPQQLRRMVARGERLAQRATAAQMIATAADRQRIAQESQAWKSILSTWRLVVAALPDRAALEQPFAFMQEYMSVTRSAPTAAAPQLPPA